MTDSNSAKRLHIVYVWDADYPWDVRTEKICRALTDAGHDVHIVARNRKWGRTKEVLPEGTVHRMQAWRAVGHQLDTILGFPAFFSPRWTALIATTARRARADVIIARDIPLCPAAIYVARRLRIPIILDLAEHYPALIRAIWAAKRQRPLDWLVRNPTLVAWVERSCLHSVNHIFTVAEEMTDRLVTKGVDRSRISLVGNTPSERANKHHHHKRPTNNRPIRPTNNGVQLVYLGLLEIARGIDDLIDAIACLHASNYPVTLLLIGDGRDEQLFRNRAAAAGLTAQTVTFAGHIPYRRAIKLMAAADVGVLPLHHNAHMDSTIPNKLFDYMSVGLPVITSDTAPSARIIRAENAGVVFKARSVPELVKAIISLSDPCVRSRLGANGIKAVRQRYNWGRDAAVLVNAVVRTVNEHETKHAS